MAKSMINAYRFLSFVHQEEAPIWCREEAHLLRLEEPMRREHHCWVLFIIVDVTGHTLTFFVDLFTIVGGTHLWFWMTFYNCGWLTGLGNTWWQAFLFTWDKSSLPLLLFASLGALTFRVCGAATLSLMVGLFSLEDDADMVNGVIGYSCGRQLQRTGILRWELFHC